MVRSPGPAPPTCWIRLRPAFNASTAFIPLADASPAAAKNIASNTPDEPPIVWLSSRPDCPVKLGPVRQRQRSSALMSAREAVERVDPVSPSPDFASRAFKSPSAAIRISQHLRMSVSACLFFRGHRLNGCQAVGQWQNIDLGYRMASGPRPRCDIRLKSRQRLARQRQQRNREPMHVERRHHGCRTYHMADLAADPRPDQFFRKDRHFQRCRAAEVVEKGNMRASFDVAAPAGRQSFPLLAARL